MLSTNYNSLKFADVDDLADLYHSGLPEMNRIKAVIEACKNLFKLPANKVKLQVTEGDRVYKIMLYSPDISNSNFGWIVYLPLQKQLDIYNSDNPMSPFIQYQSKKIVYKGYPIIYDRAGFDKIFDRIVNASI